MFPTCFFLSLRPISKPSFTLSSGLWKPNSGFIQDSSKHCCGFVKALLRLDYSQLTTLCVRLWRIIEVLYIPYVPALLRPYGGLTHGLLISCQSLTKVLEMPQGLYRASGFMTVFCWTLLGFFPGNRQSYLGLSEILYWGSSWSINDPSSTRYWHPKRLIEAIRLGSLITTNSQENELRSWWEATRIDNRALPNNNPWASRGCWSLTISQVVP